MRTLLLSLLLLAPLYAQDDELPPDEIADIVERYVERGYESMRDGSYEEARLRFKKALKRDPKHKTARLGIAETYAALGAYDKAEKELAKHLETHPGDRAGKTALARLDLKQGRLAKAGERAKEVIQGGGEGPDPVGMEARSILAEALMRRGRRDEARTVLDFFLDYNDKRMDSWSQASFDRDTLKHKPEVARPLSRELTQMGRALRQYVELSPLDNEYIRNANELLLLAIELDRENWDAWIERVRVSRAEREGALAAARKARDVVTPTNPELADLWTEVAKSLMTGFGSGEARAMAENALKINPKQTDARAIVAQVALEDNEYGTASEHIEAGLAVDPYHRPLLALKATQELLLGHADEFEKGMKALLDVDPTYGQGFHLAGLVVAARQRRYDRAAELVRRGLKIDPTNFQAHASLGIFLANEGREKEALEALTKSRKLFPWSHPIRDNFRTVLDYVNGEMTDLKTEHFVFRIDPSEHEILSRFLPELMEACWDDMVKRYGFTPQAPVLVEVFKKAGDFSVRTLGIENVPALGACFGGLITLDSPQALPEGEFLWSSTARHEFAHVISLQLSKGQVPRWFTEGLSVLEEKPLDVGWGREAGFEKQVFDAYFTGSLPEIATFDAMFRTPRVGFAYYVGGLMLEFLHKKAGEKGIVKALELWGKDAPMEEVFSEAFGLKLNEFDEQFRAHIGERVKAYHVVPNYAAVMADLREKVLKDPTDGESLLQLAWAHVQRREFIDAAARFDLARAHLDADKVPSAILLQATLALNARRGEAAVELYRKFFAAGGEDYTARMNMAAYHRSKHEEELMVEHLEKAAAAWPMAMAPLQQLRRYYMANGRDDDALAILVQATRIASKSVRDRLQLAREYASRGRDADAIRTLEEALGITLFNGVVYDAVIPLYRKAGEKKKAVRAARCRVALRADDDSDEQVANRWLTLAEVLLEDGQKGKAKAAVAEAKRLVDPDELSRLGEIEKKLGQ